MQRLNDLFKKQRELRIVYKQLINPQKDNGETCLFYGCKDNCIKSHSISRNVLKAISDNNEVIFPIIDPCNMGKNIADFENSDSPNIKFERQNIASSGVYRGFCKNHDNSIFLSLDSHGIVTQRDIFLQLYRTVCKYSFLCGSVEKSEWSVFRQYYYSNPEYEKKISLPIDKLKDFLEDMLTDFPELDVSIPNVNKSFVIKPWSNKVDVNCLILYRRIPKEFNFAIENDIILKNNGRISHFVFVLLPGADYTSLFAISSPDLIKLLHSHLCSEIQILNTIESIMIHDSQFYLSPNIVENWSSEKKRKIIDDFFFITERKFLQEYDISIFDNLRSKIIEKECDEIKKHELRKIDVLPERMNFKERFKMYEYKSIKDRQDKVRFTGNEDGKNYPIGSLIVE